MPLRKQDFHKISDSVYELPRGYRDDMLVPVRVFADGRMLEEALGDRSLEQAVNAATLPGLVGHVLVMPDVHQGYGFPIGGVAATRLPDGVISPGGIGYDINCGVRALATSIEYEAVRERLSQLATELYRLCPSGVGEEGSVPLGKGAMDEVCREGARWALAHGYATAQDLARTEEGGGIDGADPAAVSQRARERAKGQLGSLGSGNHFVEVDVVDEVFDVAAAAALGLYAGCLAAQIHCGSRGLGHQICTDYVQSFQTAVKRHGIVLPDRELVCAPLSSPEGQAYLGAMKAAANFAFCNRQVLAHRLRQGFENVLGPCELMQVYDIAHNMGKVETHRVDGKRMQLCVHRKGATRAFGRGFADLPPEYRELGQPVLVPGSMGTASWVMLGTATSEEQSLGSCCHGAGRVMSRSQAKKTIRGAQLKQELEAGGIRVRAGSLAGLAEEAPAAYKDVDRVIDIVVSAGIARKVARLRPVAVVKG